MLDSEAGSAAASKWGAERYVRYKARRLRERLLRAGGCVATVGTVTTGSVEAGLHGGIVQDALELVVLWDRCRLNLNPKP